MKPIVAIVGRPNVGKSTFFNRITKTRNAIVDNLPGVTRDRNFGDVVWNNTSFTVVDTGGFIQGDENHFALDIRWQVERAIEDADVVIMILDGKNGVSPFDIDMIKLLRSITNPVMYVVNKVDSPIKEDIVNDFYVLGVDKLYSLSAEHGYGVSSFLDVLIGVFPYFTTNELLKDLINIAVVGRPNAGKSSLVNSIIGENRLVVSEIPGTTRDAIDSEVIVNGKPYLIVDTAGIRRKGKVSAKIEKFSIIKALRRLDNCDIALIVIDAQQGITDQDIRIAGYADNRGCGAIFVINKWDLINNQDGKTLKRYYDQLKTTAKFLKFAPAISISALTGLRVTRIFKIIDEVYTQYSYRINTGRLNRIIQRAIEINEPSIYKAKRLKFYYTTQVTTKPPTIVSFVNYPNAVHFSYKRYLLNKLREATGLVHTPLKLLFRQRSGGNPIFLNKKPNKGQVKKFSSLKNKKIL